MDKMGIIPFAAEKKGGERRLEVDILTNRMNIAEETRLGEKEQKDEDDYTTR